MRSAFAVRCVIVSLLFFVCIAAAPAGEYSLWQIQRTLASKKFVDLTHEFAPGIPRWPGFPDETRKTIYWYDKRPDAMGSGFFSELFTHVGQWGTHVDPPAHFVKGLRRLTGTDICDCAVKAQLAIALQNRSRLHNCAAAKIGT